ncbi:MAG: class I SAM-dependent methyltransferase [Gemmatimonadales bacterium]
MSTPTEFNYDAIADSYAAKVDAAPYNALYERPAMIALLPEIDGARILDAGCGSGWYAGQLLSRGAIVDGVDASASMVDYARRRLLDGASPETQQRLTIQVADLAEPLPFEDEKFDGILSPLVLHYMRDWRPALREMKRVLKANGWLLFSTHHPAADAALFATANYLATEHVVDHWDWVGNVEFYRRSLTEIVSSVIESGFTIEKLVEPAPTEEFRLAKPDSYTRLMQQPEFLIIQATVR